MTAGVMGGVLTKKLLHFPILWRFARTPPRRLSLNCSLLRAQVRGRWPRWLSCRPALRNQAGRERGVEAAHLEDRWVAGCAALWPDRSTRVHPDLHRPGRKPKTQGG